MNHRLQGAPDRGASTFRRCLWRASALGAGLLAAAGIWAAPAAEPAAPQAHSTVAQSQGATGAMGTAEPPAPVPARQAELMHLLRQDCGACHGMTRQGGLGSPITAQALVDRPEDSLVATILQGRPGTAMPPWQPFMTPAEARWLVWVFKNGKGLP